MRARIKVTDLSLAQWAWLNLNLPESQEFAPDDVRMCVELELTSQQSPVHIELAPRAFVGLLDQLATIERLANDLTTCDHGARIAEESPSQFEGRRVLTFKDGCFAPAVPIHQARAMVVPDPDWADRLANGAYER